MAKKAPRQSGFALFAVIVILALVSAAVALSLDEAVESIQAAGRIRNAEIVRAGLDHGLAQAVSQLQTMDLSDFRNGQDWDIFQQDQLNPPTAADMPVPNPAYPLVGDYQGTFRIRLGARVGQRTRAAGRGCDQRVWPDRRSSSECGAKLCGSAQQRVAAHRGAGGGRCFAAEAIGPGSVEGTAGYET